MAESCCNVPSSTASVHTGTKTEVAPISKKFSHRLANFGAWQGSWEYIESTPWPPLQAPLKAGLWVSDREDVEAHCRLLVRPVLNLAVEVSSGEVPKGNVGKGSESREIWASHGSVTAVPNEIKLLRYNLVIVEVPRRGGWNPSAQIVRVLSPGVLGAFHGHHGDLVAMEQHLCSQLEDLYPIALRTAVYHRGRRKVPYLHEHSTVLLVKTHGLGPAVPHFLTQKSITEGSSLGLAILWWLVNLLKDPNDDSDDTPTTSGHGFMTPKICSMVGLQILVSATLRPRRDSLRPYLSGSGWCQGNGGKAFRLVPSFPSGAMWCPTTPPKPCAVPRSPCSSECCLPSPLYLPGCPGVLT